MANEKKDLRLYYSIKEVSQMTNLPDSTLRYWEKQFKDLSPKKTSSGIRQYTTDDIEIIRLIHHLVKDQGLTIQAARERLRTSKSSCVDSSEIVRLLQNVRGELQSMIDELR